MPRWHARFALETRPIGIADAQLLLGVLRPLLSARRRDSEAADRLGRDDVLHGDREPRSA